MIYGVRVLNIKWARHRPGRPKEVIFIVEADDESGAAAEADDEFWEYVKREMDRYAMAEIDAYAVEVFDPATGKFRYPIYP